MTAVTGHFLSASTDAILFHAAAVTFPFGSHQSPAAAYHTSAGSISSAPAAPAVSCL